MIRRRIVALILASGLATAPALAQEPSAPQPRQPMSRLSPQQDAIQLIQGERLTVTRTPDGRFEIKSDEIIDAAAIGGIGQRGKAPPGQIVFSFAGSAATGMLLKIDSGLDYSFRYRGVMLLPGPAGQVTPRPTSLCVVHPKVVGMEHWPQPIAAIVLSNFEKAPDDDFSCK